MSTLASPALEDGPDIEFFNVTLWVAQIVVGVVFCAAGLFKLHAPMAELVATLKWPGEFAPWFVRTLGAVDLLGGIGIVLPALTRIQPRVTVWAASGCVTLQVLAIGFHASGGEWSVLPLNFILLPLALYVLGGRSRVVPIEALRGMAARQRSLSFSLWAAQGGAAAVFCGAGLFKLTAPLSELTTALPFARDIPGWAVRAIGVVDLAGGLGLLLPALTRILPGLTVLAAAGCVTVQALAMGLHTSRHEFSVLPLNGVLITLSAYVCWGRWSLLPIVALHGEAARQRFVTVSLWLAQAVAALIFTGAGLFKLSAPMPELAAAMKWPGDMPEAMVRLIGAIDLAGGLGLLLPALTRILPHLTVIAAAGCSALQMLAIGFHLSRSEWSALPLNFVLLPLALYVLWGRQTIAQVTPRH